MDWGLVCRFQYSTRSQLERLHSGHEHQVSLCVCVSSLERVLSIALLCYFVLKISNCREWPWHISHFLLQPNLCVCSCSFENSHGLTHGLEAFSVVAVGTVQFIQRRTFLPKNQCFWTCFVCVFEQMWLYLKHIVLVSKVAYLLY